MNTRLIITDRRGNWPPKADEIIPMEEGLAETLNVTLGDTMEARRGDTRFRAKVTSLPKWTAEKVTAKYNFIYRKGIERATRRGLPVSAGR